MSQKVDLVHVWIFTIPNKVADDGQREGFLSLR